MIVLALDPGPQQTAWVKWNPTEKRVMACDIQPNEHVIQQLVFCSPANIIAIENVACFGMPVGREVFETCIWIGRYFERCPTEPRLVYRRDVKLHHCQSARAKDGNIRQSLIDKYGTPGTKKAPGVTYGLKSHLWSAFAIATFISETSG